MKTILIGIAGVSASGKTTVAKSIVDSFDSKQIRILKLDDYYKDQSSMPMEERIVTNYDHPNAFDFDLLKTHLQILLDGKEIEKPEYDFSVHNRKEKKELISSAPIIILEGILVFSEEEIRNLLDIKIYVDADSDVCFIRRMQRDINERGRQVEDIVKQYLTTVKPMQERFIEPTKKYADIIIPNPDGRNIDVAINVIRNNIKKSLQD